TLVFNGFLGSSPQKPTVAISLKVLNTYQQLCHACPRLSMQAFVRLLCDLHQIPIKHLKHLVKQFCDAYDIYLDIQYRINKLVDSTLGRDTPDWRMHNTCAPCLYKLDNKPALKCYPSLLCWPGARPHQRRRVCHSSSSTMLFATAKCVQMGKRRAWTCVTDAASVDAALPAGPASVGTTYDHNNDIAWLDLLNREDGDKLNASIDVRMEHWQNAGPEARKKMFALFAKTGIFVCLCRHGQLLILCNMIRSGKLMKYPLAIVHKLMEVYNPNILVGYDIACVFAKTLTQSSLGPEAHRLHMAGVVPAFHGHGHNHGCQVNWHPLYMDRVGKEDFEGCEHCFSELNALAA
ncbi:uncharacterized protein C8Q71DRAFT_691273, partial [Rhodofomes roseus]